jgi:hypothetical protein
VHAVQGAIEFILWQGSQVSGLAGGTSKLIGLAPFTHTLVDFESFAATCRITAVSSLSAGWSLPQIVHLVFA